MVKLANINSCSAVNAIRIKTLDMLIRSLAYVRYVLRVVASQLEALFSTSLCLESEQELMEKRRKKKMMSRPSLMN
jgi:hypothetical protein